MPYTADLRIEAWAPTRDGDIKEPVLGTIESFLDTSLAYPQMPGQHSLARANGHRHRHRQSITLSAAKIPSAP